MGYRSFNGKGNRSNLPDSMSLGCCHIIYASIHGIETSSPVKTIPYNKRIFKPFFAMRLAKSLTYVS